MLGVKLVVGEANYSTWSMRPWVFLTGFGVAFDDVFESLTPQRTLRERLLRHSPSARVPVLVDGGLTVWDSLAICQYVDEVYLDGVGLPAARGDRATARALVAEMHSGFAAMRSELPMNIRARRIAEPSPAALADIARIDEIWSSYTAGSDGLFGAFSMADAFYAPVAMRLMTYDITLSPPAAAYYRYLCACPPVRQWCEKAQQETSIVAKDETGTPR